MPKRNRSAYFLFSMDARAKLKAQSRDQLTPLEMQSKVSQYWKELSPSEKKVYESRAKQEKIEYLVAMDKFYSSLTPETLERTKTNRPKKPCSAYAHFVRDIKVQLKQDNPKLIMQEVLHIVGEKWKALSEQEKQVYEEKARLDKEKYLIATHRYFPCLQKVAKAKSQNYQGTQKPVKRLEENLKEASIEDQLFKKVKLEPSVVKTEETSNGESHSMETIKMEQEQRISSIISSPITVKTEGEIPQEFQVEQLCKMEPLSFAENAVCFENPQSLEMPELMNQQQFGEFSRNYQNVDFYVQQRIKELTIAKLHWMKIAQANQNFDQAIMRKVAEARNLHAQRQMLVQRLFGGPSNGIY